MELIGQHWQLPWITSQSISKLQDRSIAINNDYNTSLLNYVMQRSKLNLELGKDLALSSTGTTLTLDLEDVETDSLGERATGKNGENSIEK